MYLTLMAMEISWKKAIVKTAMIFIEEAFYCECLASCVDLNVIAMAI